MSSRLMYEDSERLFCLEVSFIGGALLAVLTFGIGYVILRPYWMSRKPHFFWC